MAGQESLISVIIPAFNSEHYLEQAIESVLAQTYQPVEIIVINDGSTDGTDAIAQQFIPKIQYYIQPNKGLGATRNRGVELAKGTFLAFLDADDIWLAKKLEHQMKLFRDAPDLDMVFGYAKQFISPELDEELKAKLSIPGEILPGYFAGTLLIKRKAFLSVGYFDTDWRVGEFIDWYSKAQTLNLKATLLPEVVLRRRIHDSNMGIREREHQVDYARILKAALDRRRKMAASQETLKDHKN